LAHIFALLRFFQNMTLPQGSIKNWQENRISARNFPVVRAAKGVGHEKKLIF
jgi:hypothetical protein